MSKPYSQASLNALIMLWGMIMKNEMCFLIGNRSVVIVLNNFIDGLCISLYASSYSLHTIHGVANRLTAGDLMVLHYLSKTDDTELKMNCILLLQDSFSKITFSACFHTGCWLYSI